MKNIEILGVVIFKRLFCENQRGEKNSIKYICKDEQMFNRILISFIADSILSLPRSEFPRVADERSPNFACRKRTPDQVPTRGSTGASTSAGTRDWESETVASMFRGEG